MFCVHLSEQRLQVSANLIVRLFLRLLGTSSGPRVWWLPSTALLGVGPPSLRRSCSVLPGGHLHSRFLPPAPSLLGWVEIYGFTFSCYYLRSVLGAFLRKQERIGGGIDGLGCGPTYTGSAPPAPTPEAGPPDPSPGSCPHPWRLVPAGPSRGLASGFAGNMLRSQLSDAQWERSLAPPSFLREPGRAGMGAHGGWAKVCWAASAGMRSHLSHRLILCCLIWTFGLSLSLWILKCL